MERDGEHTTHGLDPSVEGELSQGHRVVGPPRLEYAGGGENAQRHALSPTRPAAAAVLLLLAVTAAPVCGEETAALDIIRNPSSYTNHYVTVRGSMMNVRPATTGGIAASTAVVFNLVDGSAILTVLSPVPPACQIGSTVTVDGRFAPTSQLGSQVYANLLHATLVNCR